MITPSKLLKAFKKSQKFRVIYNTTLIYHSNYECLLAHQQPKAVQDALIALVEMRSGKANAKSCGLTGHWFDEKHKPVPVQIDVVAD